MIVLHHFYFFRMLPVLLLLVSVCFISACGATTEDSDGGSASEEDLIQPNLTSLQEKLFSPRCSNASCHGGNNPVRGLDLTEGKTRDSVFGVDSTISGWKYVVPNDVDSSLLYQAVIRAMGDEDLRQMPPGLSIDQEAQEALRQWIEDGAQN